MQYLPYVSILIALGGLLWQVVFAPGRADKVAADARLHKLEMEQSNTGNRLTGFQLELERVADTSDKRCHAIETQLAEVPRLREDFAGVKVEVKHLTEGLHELKSLVREVLGILNKRP